MVMLFTHLPDSFQQSLLEHVYKVSVLQRKCLQSEQKEITFSVQSRLAEFERTWDSILSSLKKHLNRQVSSKMMVNFREIRTEESGY